MLKSRNFPITVPNRTSKRGLDFSLQSSHLSFTAAYNLKSEKDWFVDFAELRGREPDSVYNHVSWGATSQ